MIVITGLGTRPSPGGRDAGDVRSPAQGRFGILLGGQTVSALGDAFSNVAMPLLVLSTTGSVAQMGLVAGVSTAAQLGGGVVAGPVVDRLDRRRLLVLCDMAQLVLGASIPVVWWLVTPEAWGRYGMTLIYVVVAASSFLVSLSSVALRAVMPQVVGRTRLVSANGRLTTATEVAYGSGPVVAGLTIAALGEPTAIGINALTYGVSALAWFFVRPRRVVGPPERPGNQSPAGRLAGMRFIWRNPVQRSLALLEVANGLLVAGTTVLFIYYVRTEFGAGSTVVGLLLTLASVGAVLAALVAPRARKVLGLGRAWLVAVALEGVALVAAGLTGALWGVAALAALFAFGQIASIILAMSYHQERSPDHLLGRVTAAMLTLLLAARAVGGVLTTTAAGLSSAKWVFVAIGTGVLAVVAAGCRTSVWHPEPAVRTNP
jgi:MFS family permease